MPCLLPCYLSDHLNLFQIFFRALKASIYFDFYLKKTFMLALVFKPGINQLCCIWEAYRGGKDNILSLKPTKIHPPVEFQQNLGKWD